MGLGTTCKGVGVSDTNTVNKLIFMNQRDPKGTLSCGHNRIRFEWKSYPDYLRRPATEEREGDRYPVCVGRDARDIHGLKKKKKEKECCCLDNVSVTKETHKGPSLLFYLRRTDGETYSLCSLLPDCFYFSCMKATFENLTSRI